MAKEIIKLIKLQIKAGVANLFAPQGPALGQAGVNIMAFCKEFNAQNPSPGRRRLAGGDHRLQGQEFYLRHRAGLRLVTFSRRPPISLRVRLEPHKKKVGKLTEAQRMDVVKIKTRDMNTTDEEAAARTLAGTARQMGIDIDWGN